MATKIKSIFSNIWYICILILGKSLYRILRILKYNATTLPGKVVVRLCPGIFRYLTKNISLIIITGTNGKTTTCRMLTHILLENQMPCISNLSGANMRYGIATTLFTSCNLAGKFPVSHAVLECDEGDFYKIAKYITSPEVTILVTNLFEDQLARFGSSEHVRNLLLRGLSHLPHAHLCLNSDCALTTSLAQRLPNPFIFYGFRDYVATHRFSITEEIPSCPVCGQPLHYHFHTVGHLGHYECPSCHMQRPGLTVDLSIGESEQVLLHTEDHSFTYTPNYPISSCYRLYNSLSAASVLYHMGYPDLIKDCFTSTYTNPGRHETLLAGNAAFTLILAKNPVGYQQVLEEYALQQEPSNLIFSLSNALSDGKDISWIYQIDFSPLADILTPGSTLYFCGSRAEEMSNYLKETLSDSFSYLTETDFAKLYQALPKKSSTYTIFTTYSNMNYIRNTLLSQADSLSPKT